MHKNLYIALFVFFLPLFSMQALDFSHLDESEQKILNSGKAHIQTISSIKNLVLAHNIGHPFYEVLKKIKPNYITEAYISIEHENPKILLQTLYNSLIDFPTWVGIPYYSQRQKEWYDLFSMARVLNKETDKNIETWQVHFAMQPFTPYTAHVRLERDSDKLFFTVVNEESMAYEYNGARAIKAQNMVWYIEAEINADRLLIYGIGAVYAFDLFGIMRDRLEVAINGRIHAFLGYQFDKVNAKISEK